MAFIIVIFVSAIFVGVVSDYVSTYSKLFPVLEWILYLFMKRV